MTLKELLEKTPREEYLNLYLMEDGVEYQCGNGYETIYAQNEGKVPENFTPYLDCPVIRCFADTRYIVAPASRAAETVGALGIEVIAEPTSDCEIVYTGGGIYCGVCKVEGGWFFGGVNADGGIWKTYSQALESYPEEEYGFIRFVDSTEELKAIWTRIYTTVDSPLCKELLATLDGDLQLPC